VCDLLFFKRINAGNVSTDVSCANVDSSIFWIFAVPRTVRAAMNFACGNAITRGDV
jgi:hypothetical protein